jgi:glyoxylase-like metal-dependent hydrolase (beta-lactamase superfamily II)
MLKTTLMKVGSCRHCERMVRSGGSWRAVAFPSMCALIMHPTVGPILYDTGYADHFTSATIPFPERLYRWTTPMRLPADETLAAQLARGGLRPSDVRVCVISHFHADHVAGLRDLPNARFICLRDDYDATRRGHRFGRVRKGLLTALLPDDFESRLKFANDGPTLSLPVELRPLGSAIDLFGDGTVAAVRLPGHTAGHLGLLFTDSHARRVLLCADAAWQRQAWAGRERPARVAGLVIHDWQAYLETLGRLRAVEENAPDLAIVPSHCTVSIDAYSRSGT